MLWICPRLSICCSFVVQLVVQHFVQQIRNKSKCVEFVRTLAGGGLMVVAGGVNVARISEQARMPCESAPLNSDETLTTRNQQPQLQQLQESQR